MLTQLAKGLMLGVGAAAPIGPVNVEIIRRTLKHGWRAGVALGLGAVTVDVTYALLTSLVFSQLSEGSTFYRTIQLAGAILLTVLGILCWVEAIKALRSTASAVLDEPPHSPLHRGYLAGLLMTFFNPMTVFFWFTAVPGAVRAGQSRTDLPIICTGVFVATLTWVVLFTGTLKWLRRWRRPWWMTAADALGGSMLLGFAGYAFWTSLHRFL